MKKILLLILPLLFSSFIYSQVLQNPSFEEWEMENGKHEPVEWSGVQTCIPPQLAGVAPKTLTKSDDAHTGECSVRLDNVSTFGIVATGTITNGRVFASMKPNEGFIFTDPNDERWYTLVKGYPDSLVGWYKFQPPASGTDFPTVKALLHLDSAQIPDPDSANYVATIYGELPSVQELEWKRFSFPFKYINKKIPEYVLILLTSGNGTDAIAGSKAWFDDLELIYNTTSIDERQLNELTQVYGSNNKIIVNLTKFGMGNNFKIAIFNLIGQSVYSGKLITGNRLTIENIKSGFYFCIITSDDGRTVSKKVMVR